MSERTWSFGGLARYQSGPWDGEPDKVQWVDAETDLDCLIVRNRSGALCGYVGVPPGHPLHGEDYMYVDGSIDVHGGLTYAAPCQEGAGETGVCHVPEPGRPADVWWFGFDCGHIGDRSPRHQPADLDFGGVYRTVDYVRVECWRLAAQLVKVLR